MLRYTIELEVAAGPPVSFDIKVIFYVPLAFHYNGYLGLSSAQPVLQGGLP